MRLFYAIEFTEIIKKQLTSYQDLIRKKIDKANYTKLENFHLTLKYVGYINKKELAKYKEYLEQIEDTFNPFSIRIRKIGYFEKRYGDIIYAEVERNTRLRQLQHKINRIVDTGVANNFKPHVTLARNAKIKKFESIKEVKKIKCEKIEYEVKMVSLMESKKVNTEIKYLPIKSVKI